MLHKLLESLLLYDKALHNSSSYMINLHSHRSSCLSSFWSLHHHHLFSLSLYGDYGKNPPL